MVCFKVVSVQLMRKGTGEPRVRSVSMNRVGVAIYYDALVGELDK